MAINSLIPSSTLSAPQRSVIKTNSTPTATSGVLTDIVSIGNKGGWFKWLNVELGGATSGTGPFTLNNLLIRVTVDDVTYDYTCPSITWSSTGYYMWVNLQVVNDSIGNYTKDPFTFSSASGSSTAADSQDIYLTNDTLNLAGTPYAFPALTSQPAQRIISIYNANNPYATFNKNLKVSIQATNGTGSPGVYCPRFEFYGGANL